MASTLARGEEMKAVIYCRVSTKSQAEDELPIDRQEATHKKRAGKL
jgi:DNA invertase Pin-like site-specific DNA recombinase